MRTYKWKTDRGKTPPPPQHHDQSKGCNSPRHFQEGRKDVHSWATGPWYGRIPEPTDVHKWWRTWTCGKPKEGIFSLMWPLHERTQDIGLWTSVILSEKQDYHRTQWCHSANDVLLVQLSDTGIRKSQFQLGCVMTDQNFQHANPPYQQVQASNIWNIALGK